MDIKAFYPVIIIQLVAIVAALIDLFRNKKTRNLSVGIWAVIIVVFGLLGPILYFTVGREED